jgi:CRP/FNR family transcriptional regulator, cyclic AMP receptor protein
MPADFRYFSLFKGVQQEDLRGLAMRAVTRAYPKHAIIISEGDATDAIYMILSGRVKVYLSDESGKELVLAIKGAGEYFGEMALDGGPREASVMTLEPSQLAVILSGDFRAFVVEHADVALRLFENLSRVARGINQKIRGVAMLDVYGRVARVLLELAVEREGKLVIPDKLTQRDIANRVGASREMINRILRELSAGGYVTVSAGRITIHKAPPPHL